MPFVRLGTGCFIDGMQPSLNAHKFFPDASSALCLCINPTSAARPLAMGFQPTNGIHRPVYPIAQSISNALQPLALAGCVSVMYTVGTCFDQLTRNVVHFLQTHIAHPHCIGTPDQADYNRNTDAGEFRPRLAFSMSIACAPQDKDTVSAAFSGYA